MLEEAFSVYFRRNNNSLFLAEEKEGIIKHLTHLEELILTGKKAGLDTAISFINELKEVFAGHTTDKIFTTVKYDGAPAVIAGYNPENDRFFVSTKGIANVNPKINYTNEDIERNHGNAPGLVEKLKLALQYLPSVIKSNIYQGDFMFDSRDLKSVDVDGEKLITFKPNTITYAVESDSDLGKKIANSKIGIVFHTRLSGPSLAKLTKSSDVNVSEFNQTTDVWVDDAKFKDVSGIVTFTEDELKEVDGFIESINSISTKVNWDELPDNFYILANTFINTLIREGKFVTDSNQAYNDFIAWYEKRATAEIEKLKTPRGKEQKVAALKATLDNFNNKKEIIVSIFELTKKIEQIKKLFIYKYNSAIKTKQFITQPDGTLKVTAPEGYVAVDHLGNMVKLVDRLEFSRANFSVSKGDKFK